VLVGGQVAEEGSHDELIARNGEFARLYNLQFGQNEVSSDNTAPVSGAYTLISR
jgi:hypothetical protein